MFTSREAWVARTWKGSWATLLYTMLRIASMLTPSMARKSVLTITYHLSMTYSKVTRGGDLFFLVVHLVEPSVGGAQVGQGILHHTRI